MRTDLGKSGVRVMGAWSSATAYEKNDIVSNGGSSYISIQSVPAGTALSNSSYWLMIAQKGDKGDKGDTGATGATGATGNGISSVEVEETSVVGSVHTYTLTISMTDGTGEVFTYDVTDGAVTSVNGRTGAVTGLAEDNGYYEDMTVGGAEQLISSTYVEDSVPYVFRTSGGSADIGDREFDEIHGGTIAWNQKVPVANTTRTSNSVVFTLSTDGSVTANGTADGTAELAYDPINVSKGHVVLLTGCPSGGSGSTYAYLDNAQASNKYDYGNGIVYKTDSSYNVVSPKIRIYNGTQVNNLKFYPQIIDLTQAFGSTIADYILALETANAGAGVAWFKSLFPKPYYAYNAGELISVSGLSAHKMTGFNQWDEEWEVGGISNTTGNNTVATTTYRSKNYIPIVVGHDYYLKYNGTDTIGLRFYNANKELIGSYALDAPANSLLERGTNRLPVGTAYIRFVNTSTNVYKNDICINLHWDGERNGEYEAYESHSYALDYDVTLRGIPKLDADNKLYYDGDVYASDGTVTRKYGIVDLGTLIFSQNQVGTNTFEAYCNLNPAKANGINNFICNKLTYSAYADDGGYGIRGYGSSGLIVVRLPISVASTSQAVKQWCDDNDVWVIYELATPTTESAEPYTNPQIVDDWGTEEYVIAEQSGVKMPVGHDTDYKPNLRAKLEMSPDSPSAGNGDYVVRQTNGINEYVKLVIPTELPTAPSSDGNYILKCTVNGSTVTYTWESAT